MADTSVKVSFIGDSSHLKRAIDDVDGKVDGFKSKLGGVAKVAAAAGIAALGTELFAAGKAFAEDEKAAASLAKTLENTVGATKAQVDQVEQFINKTQNASGVLDDQLRPALETLLRGTGDVTKAQKLMSLAMDISAGTGKDLGSVTDALSKAANGNFKALKALDPALADLIKDGASTDEIMGSLAKTFEGQTARAALTTAGKIAIAKARFSDLQEEIGAKVVPAMAALAEFISTKLIPAIEAIVHWMEENKTVVIAAAAVIGTVLVAAFIAWAASAAAAAAATLVALAPVIAITVAIAALVAGIIYAYTHWGWFKTAVDAVGTAIGVVFNWLKDNWPLVLGILTGPFGLAVLAIVKNFDTIRETFADVYGFFVMIKDKIYDAIKGPFEDAFNFVKAVYDKTIAPIIDALRWVGDRFGGTAGPGSTQFGSGPGGSTVYGGQRAMGGPVFAGRSYLVGERGPELFSPGRSGAIVPNGGGDMTFIWEVDGQVLGKAVVNASNRSGGLPIRIRAAS